MYITDLARIVPPPPGPPAKQYDWHEIESQFVRLPDDYKLFINVYGAGRFWGGELGIAPPSWIEENRPDADNGYVEFFYDCADARPADIDIEVVGNASDETVYGSTEDTYLVFGAAGTGQTLFWRTNDSDPNRWPVLVTDGSAIDYDANGMVDYLVYLLGGKGSTVAFGDDWLGSVTRLNSNSPYVRIDS